MATIDAPRRSSASLATSRSLDADVELSLSRSPAYPEGTVFVPLDLAEPRLIQEYRSRGLPVAIVHGDGQVDLLRPRVRTETIVIALLAAAAIVWLSSRTRGGHELALGDLRRAPSL
jgi:hypothetical protein